MKAFYQNVRGLRTKSHIRSDISASQYDFIIFTEHWLNDDFKSSEYFDDSYFVERDDRRRLDKKWGGGALIAIKSFVAYRRCCEWERKSPFENVWVEIKSNSNSQKMFINVVYIPPRSTKDQYDRYLDTLTEIMCVHEPNAKFLIFGDFNMGSSIEWIIFENECDPISRGGDIANELVNTLAVNDLKQINYVRNEINSRILDLVLTNTDNFTLSPAPELSVIDKLHPPFMVEFTYRDVKLHQKRCLN